MTVHIPKLSGGQAAEVAQIDPELNALATPGRGLKETRDQLA